ncbi:MAG: glycogen/starch synthase [Desulfobacteraceae bacterium]|nr:glycogen/starch synthase [Desulfobacteraceae bacterium]
MVAINNSSRVLFVSPEVARVPENMGPHAVYAQIKTGGLAEFSAALIGDLWRVGIDLHLVMPWPGPGSPPPIRSTNHIHFTKGAKGGKEWITKTCYTRSSESIFQFQKEVIQDVLPRIKPDIVHCNDYMTGLIVAEAMRQNIPTLFTMHSVHSMKVPEHVSLALGWNNFILNQHATIKHGHISGKLRNLLALAILSATHVNTVSPTFLKELMSYKHLVSQEVLECLKIKEEVGQLSAILNTPDFSFNPAHDPSLVCNYDSSTHPMGKKENKLFLQKALGLKPDAEAPLFYWPSRLDSQQKGCDLFIDILPELTKNFRGKRPEIVVIADGDAQGHLKKMALGLQNCLAVLDFDEDLSRLSYGASDFILMPSKYEPCGYPQLIGPIYGSIPIAHDTGGLHDTIDPLLTLKNSGCGFPFKVFSRSDFLSAVESALAFYCISDEVKRLQIQRIMDQALERQLKFSLGRRYLSLYQQVLEKDASLTGCTYEL